MMKPLMSVSWASASPFARIGAVLTSPWPDTPASVSSNATKMYLYPIANPTWPP